MHELARRESTAYNLSGIYHIDSAPDLVPERLRRAVHRVVERHEALRTVFRLEGDQLLQVPMRAERGFAWTHTVLAPEVRPTEVEERMALLAHTPFDLEHGPLLRVDLFTTGERAVLGVCVHHIACDGWSIPLILRDLLAAYAALERDPDAALPPLEYQYRDISQRQLDDLATGKFDGDREYWLHRLGTNLPVLQFPTDKPRGSRRGRARVTTIDLEEPTSRALRALAARHQASVFSCALSLIYVLMQRYTGAQEIVLGTPVAARDHHAGAQVGYYVNTLPLLLRVDPDDSFVSLLKSARATLFDAIDHSRFPFDLLVESLPLPRDLARSPLFDVTVTMENVSEEDLARAALALGWRLTAKSVPPADSRFDLSFHVQDTPSIRIKIEYDSALFRDDTIAVLASQLGELTRSALESAHAPIASLQLMGVQERDAVLGNLSRGDRFEWPSAATLPELIDRHVRRAPSAVALVSRTASLTYGELDHAANGVAAVLQRRGAGRGEPVILVANGTATTLIAMLGILKAGCAYVPISVDDPPARQAMIARDSGARIVLAHGEAKIAELELVDVSAIAPLASHTAPAPDGASPAYIIYTSGTTGVPKGVVVTHANAAYFVSWMASVFRVTHEDCILHRSPLVFDASVAEVFLAWCHGAKLVLASRDEGFEPDVLTRLIAQHRVTIAQFVPSVLDLVVAQPVDTVRARSNSLRQVLVAGETLRPETVRRFHERFACPLDNCYGPTEATVNASFHRTCEGEAPVPIGRPAPGAGIYVCDGAMNPVARGVAGEIWIGGPGVAAGYAGNAELTVEKFVASPFVPGERLYKTGDQGRWRADGVLEFLGRKDGQVKVRGFRIESAEVESALVAHPDIAEATVTARRFETETELVAHYRSRTPLPSAEVRTFLTARLPQYMIPAHFVHLEQFPRTPSGKIDRQSLPEPKVGGAGHRPYAVPVSGIERQVLDAWASVLRMGASEISMHDNFFELGGNSLRFLSLITVLTEMTGTKPSVADLFQNPTARGMATCLTGLPPNQVELSATPPRGYEL